MLNAITVDVEDYFHPTEIQAGVPPDRWEGLPSRVESSTHAVLELFDRHDVKGTFFILGWVAACKPGLVASIAAAKHEIGCHSFWHRLVYDLKPEEFEQDTRDAVSAIEAACGQRASVYRAPSFSITQRSMWALDVLASLGFTMDSSIYPIAHDRYGVPGYQRSAQSVATRSGPIMEVPVATVRLGTGRVAPVGGGGYFACFPTAIRPLDFESSISKRGSRAQYTSTPGKLIPINRA